MNDLIQKCIDEVSKSKEYIEFYNFRNSLEDDYLYDENQIKYMRLSMKAESISDTICENNGITNYNEMNKVRKALNLKEIIITAFRPIDFIMDPNP